MASSIRRGKSKGTLCDGERSSDLLYDTKKKKMQVVGTPEGEKTETRRRMASKEKKVQRGQAAR